MCFFVWMISRIFFFLLLTCITVFTLWEWTFLFFRQNVHTAKKSINQSCLSPTTASTTIAGKLMITVAQRQSVVWQTRRKIKMPSHRRPKIHQEPAVVQSQLFQEEMKLFLSIPTEGKERGVCPHSPRLFLRNHTEDKIFTGGWVNFFPYFRVSCQNLVVNLFSHVSLGPRILIQVFCIWTIGLFLPCH